MVLFLNSDPTKQFHCPSSKGYRVKVIVPKCMLKYVERHFFLGDRETPAWEGDPPGCRNMAQMTLENSSWIYFFNPGCLLLFIFIIYKVFLARQKLNAMVCNHLLEFLTNCIYTMLFCSISDMKKRTVWFLIIYM